MKNLSNLKILLVVFMGISLYGNGYACGQHLSIANNSHGTIYFRFPQFMPYTRILNGQELAQIVPITCNFSTNYNGKIFFYMNKNESPTTDSLTEIDNVHPMRYTYQGYQQFFSFNETAETFIQNFGCSVGRDGDKCIEAKEHNTDNVIVDCQ